MSLINLKRGGIRHTPARTLSRRSRHNVIIQKPKRAGNAAPNPPFSEIFAQRMPKKSPGRNDRGEKFPFRRDKRNGV